MGTSVADLCGSEEPILRRLSGATVVDHCPAAQCVDESYKSYRSSRSVSVRNSASSVERKFLCLRCVYLEAQIGIGLHKVRS